MATPKEHIEEIRRTKFSIGAEKPNPLTEDMHQAVKYLSAELYAKDVHFLMELIQNAEDNDYHEGVNPSLQFVITSKDITGTGATSTLLIFNNEKGFSPKNIDSICSVGRSTKKNNRKRGYIGEKGIGFKSVFLITSRPYIFSNGYQICFNESPCSECNVGYIVPEWVDENPILSDVKRLYGSSSELPTTTIVLPLKPDKVKPVKQQLSSIHPEILLFLSKIKRLSVREDTEDLKSSTISAISISSETNFVTRKNIDAESYLLHLSADEKGDHSERECSYHMWRQRFPVKQENKVENRMDVEEWVITLAFPYGERLHRGSTSPGIYAFLPTEMVTNFPFIIQADFILASSRETIRLDSIWNRGILDCVPSAFVNAFTSLVKSRKDAPVSVLPRMFGFLPVTSSPFAVLDSVRATIQSKLKEESIIPCESYTKQRFFYKPQEVGRLMPAFWDLLKMAKEQGVSLDNISTHGKYILSSAFDEEMYDDILNFLGVEYVNDEWYAKCIRSSNLVLGTSDDFYLELLLFIADNWSSFSDTSIADVPLLKYTGAQSQVSLCRINEVPRYREILLSVNSDQISWLINWNAEFQCANDRFFLAEMTQRGIFSHSKSQAICAWLVNEVKASSVSVCEYALLLSNVLGNDRKRAVTYAHFLHHSLKENYLSTREVNQASGSMPLVNNYGQVTTRRDGVLVPANGSRWVQLIVTNPWRNQGYVELGEDYLYSGYHAGVYTGAKELVEFLKSHIGASDIPDLPAPDAQIPTFFSLLTKQNALLLLEWIRNLKRKGQCHYLPSKFFNSIKDGSWLQVKLSGSVSCRPPSQSFILNSSWGSLLQDGSVIVDIPLVDESFYGDEITDYQEELKKVGVKFEFGEACEFIGNHLMSIAASSSLTRYHVLSILNFIRFLRDKCLPADNFINRIKDERWMRTSQGDRSPRQSVFYDDEWKAASQISDIPFIDREYYGDKVLSFDTELQLLCVVFGFSENYKLVVDNLKSPSRFTSLSAEAVHLMLQCMRHIRSSDKLVRVLKDNVRLKTNMGFKSPAECYLFDPTWGCLLQVFNSFPLVDVQFYGENILSFKAELKRTGVIVDFEEAAKAFAHVFRQQASLSSNNVLHILACFKKLKKVGFVFPLDLEKCIQEVKWLRTRLTDYRTPKECILFSADWASISSISLLPFIDDGENYYGKGIHEYKDDLHAMGVVVSFKLGAKFVASRLSLPQDPSIIMPAAVYSLLECVRNLEVDPNKESLLKTLSQRAAREWVKTHAGYRSPDKCLLYGADWSSTLLQEDGPFIDETFYGTNISSYSTELNGLGVVVEKSKGCSLLADYLDSHTDFMAIKRIYSCLHKFEWKPSSAAAACIWIPNGANDGRWVSSNECVLHDKDGLFGEKLYVLDKYYEKKLFSFFSGSLEVKTHPSLDDYLKLWTEWEDSGHLLSRDECVAFWVFVSKHWSAVTQNVLSENILKLPVLSDSDRILLMDKNDVFIADDLCLKDLFTQSSSQPLFVWYPQPSLQSLPRKKLLDMYKKIGARNLSESFQKSEQSTINGAVPAQVNPKEILIGRELCKLILGFLADLQVEVQERHDAVKGLLKITVLETETPVTVVYNLPLSSTKITATATRLMRWEREKSEFFMQRVDKSGGHKNVLERATYFSEVISEGVLWDKEDHIPQLAELIKLGFVMEFDEEAIGFLMKTKNLQIFSEDEEFLSSEFSSESVDYLEQKDSEHSNGPAPQPLGDRRGPAVIALGDGEPSPAEGKSGNISIQLELESSSGPLSSKCSDIESSGVVFGKESTVFTSTASQEPSTSPQSTLLPQSVSNIDKPKEVNTSPSFFNFGAKVDDRSPSFVVSSSMPESSNKKLFPWAESKPEISSSSGNVLPTTTGSQQIIAEMKKDTDKNTQNVGGTIAKSGNAPSFSSSGSLVSSPSAFSFKASTTVAKMVSSLPAASSGSLFGSNVAAPSSAIKFGVSADPSSTVLGSTSNVSDSTGLQSKAECKTIFGGISNTRSTISSFVTRSESNTFGLGSIFASSSANGQSQGSLLGAASGFSVGTVSQSMPVQFGTSASLPAFGSSSVSSPVSFGFSSSLASSSATNGISSETEPTSTPSKFGGNNTSGVNAVSSASVTTRLPSFGTSSSSLGVNPFGSSSGASFGIFGSSTSAPSDTAANTSGVNAVSSGSVATGLSSFAASSSSSGTDGPSFGIFRFGASASASTPGTTNASSNNGTSAPGLFKFGGNSSTSSVFTTTSFSGFSFGASLSPATNTNPTVLNSSSGSASSTSAFSFSAASSPVFGNPSSPFGNNDQTSPEDGMVVDTVLSSTPSLPVFGQASISPSPPAVMFGSASTPQANPFQSTPQGNNPFQFGGQHNQVAQENPAPSPFQASISLGGFSASGGGGDKSSHKFVKVNHNRNRKK